MKKAIATLAAVASAGLFAGALSLITPQAAEAATLSRSEATQLCQAGYEANQMGMSVKPMLQQVLASKGAPTYPANVILNEMKPYCPRVY